MMGLTCDLVCQAEKPLDLVKLILSIFPSQQLVLVKY